MTAKGMTKRGEKRTPESKKKQSESMKKRYQELKDAKKVAEAILSGEGMDNMLSGIYNKAMDGDVKAAELMLKLIGKMPKEAKDINLNTPITEVKLVSTLPEEDKNETNSN